MKRRRPRALFYTPAVLLVLSALFLVAGCGVTDLIKETAYSVGDYFTSDSHLRKRVVMVPFDSGIPALKKRAHAFGEKIRADLKRQNMINLIDHMALVEAMQGIPKTVRNPQTRMILGARRLGLNTIVTGNLSDLALTYDFTGIYGFRENTPLLRLESDVAIIDVASGTLLGRESFSERMEVDDLVAENIKFGKPTPANLVNKLQTKLLAKTTAWVQKTVSRQRWTGYVLEVNGDKLKTTVGRDTGVSLGDELTIYGRGEKVVTGSGRPLYMPGPMIGQVRLDKIMARTSLGTFVPVKDIKTKQLLKPGLLIRAE